MLDSASFSLFLKNAHITLNHWFKMTRRYNTTICTRMVRLLKVYRSPNDQIVCSVKNGNYVR